MNYSNTIEQQDVIIGNEMKKRNVKIKKYEIKINNII